MPILRVEMLKGRTVDQKRALVQALTQGFVATCGGDPKGVHVVIQEVDREDWGVGGELSSDKVPK